MSTLNRGSGSIQLALCPTRREDHYDDYITVTDLVTILDRACDKHLPEKVGLVNIIARDDT